METPIIVKLRQPMKRGEETAVFLSKRIEELTKLVSPSERPLTYVEIDDIDIGNNIDTVFISFMVELDGYTRQADAELKIMIRTGMLRLVHIRNVKYSAQEDREGDIPTPLIVATGTDDLCKEVAKTLKERSEEVVDLLTEGEVGVEMIEIEDVEKREFGHSIIIVFYTDAKWGRYIEEGQPVESGLILRLDNSLRMQGYLSVR